VHHFALLIGYGAGAINPYLAFETLDDMIRQGIIKDADHKKRSKTTSRPSPRASSRRCQDGISTIQSYCGAQIFEAIGLNHSVIDKYFTGTASQIEGIGIDIIAEEVRLRHRHAFPDRIVNGATLDPGGQYQWRSDGESHLFNPGTISRLQLSTRTNNYKVFQEYSELVNNQSRSLCTLRGLFDLKFAPQPLPSWKSNRSIPSSNGSKPAQ